MLNFTMEKSNSLDYFPPLARGVISALDIFTEILNKISLFSVFEKVNSQDNTDFPGVFTKALQLYSAIDENSPTERCLEFIEFINEIDNEKWIHLERIHKETEITAFHQECQKLKELVKHKMSLPLQQWKEIRKDSLKFPEIYGKLLQEMDELKHAVEHARYQRDKMMPKESEKVEEEQNKISASEDFKSLHPFFILANSEEHMEFLRIFRDKKLQTLQEQQNTAELNFKSAVVKHRKEIQNIIEETVKTKSFSEWLEEKDHSTMKEYERAIMEEWERFSSDLEESRDLSRKYKEKNAIYDEIEKEKKENIRLSRMSAAATTLQAYWRDYMKRRRLRGDFII